MRVKRRLGLLVLVMALTFTACGSKESASSEAPASAPAASALASQPAEPTPDPALDPDLAPADKVNPLTGLVIPGAGTTAQRPVAVMLNNLEKALPQKGNSQADVIYEALAEGGITRMLAVYQSVEGVGEIGSVRSARPYYLDLALGLDAIYVHAGGSEEAYADIKSWNVTSLDYVRSTAYNAIFWRDAARKRAMGSEHSVLTSGDKMTENFPNYSFRKDHAEGYALPYTFAADAAPAEGESAVTVTVPFSNIKTGVFTYDEESGKYLVSEYGKPYVDGNDGSQVAVTNVIAIRASCKVIDEVGRMKIDLAGHSGDGWFACGGRIIPITWAKADRSSPITYKKADGTPLTLGRGSSYVNIIPLSNSVTAQ